MLKKLLLTGAVMASMAGTALGQDSYVVGISGALTGPGAGTYAPVIEAVRMYFDKVNKAGGINGHKVDLVALDNQSNPSKAAADTKRLLLQDNALIIVNSSLSSTYEPMINETNRAGAPLLFGGSVCPTQVFPKADPLLFCTTSFGAHYDSNMALAFIKQAAKEDVMIGFSAMAIPVSRGEIDYAEEQAPKMGFKPVAKEIIPPPTANYGPHAVKIKDAGANWVYSWAPWVTQIKTFEALRTQGWGGKMIAFGHINAEDELARVKDDGFYVFGANALFQEGLPIHKEIEETAKAAGATFPVTQLAEGWVVAMALDAALTKTGWPASREKLAAVMNDLEIDTKGLRGGPVKWTADNHFRTDAFYRVYRWDSAKNAIVSESDWVSFPVN
ncbi:MAG: ABC transporter substrate-binding protein [Rhodobiaceae bacterium]|nr:ABC transporter substrate-binding protein [Rhodobiaceae bacterium]